ncbi:BrnA antitoxin family protein [Paraburkholderia youngii]|uniref:BrnA antitoxin family protein n=1 Tax=Paraburkholderia youngii TaxID=2782701 RepID=UPI0035D4FB93
MSATLHCLFRFIGDCRGKAVSRGECRLAYPLHRRCMCWTFRGFARVRRLPEPGTGDGWQTRMNDALRTYLARHRLKEPADRPAPQGL